MLITYSYKLSQNVDPFLRIFYANNLMDSGIKITEERGIRYMEVSLEEGTWDVLLNREYIPHYVGKESVSIDIDYLYNAIK